MAITPISSSPAGGTSYCGLIWRMTAAVEEESERLGDVRLTSDGPVGWLGPAKAAIALLSSSPPEYPALSMTSMFLSRTLSSTLEGLGDGLVFRIFWRSSSPPEYPTFSMASIFLSAEILIHMSRCS